MKLISLNTWGGRLHESLLLFLERHRSDTHIFCFQEVDDNPPESDSFDEDRRKNFFNEIKKMLPKHIGYFAPQLPGTGLVMFVHRAIEVASAKFSTVLATDEMTEKFYPRVLQCVALKEPSLSIYNFHGVPKSGKLDTPQRKIQSARILEILAADKNKKILVGDFNLRPETESLRAFEKNMRNLVIEKGFLTTRSHFYDQKDIQPFADYAFVSTGVVVKDFQVLQAEVSDHLPLMLDLE